MHTFVLIAQGGIAPAGAGRRGRCGRRSLACVARWLRRRAGIWFFQEGELLKDLHQGLLRLGRARRAQGRRPGARFVDGRAWLGGGVVRRGVVLLLSHVSPRPDPASRRWDACYTYAYMITASAKQQQKHRGNNKSTSKNHEGSPFDHV